MRALEAGQITAAHVQHERARVHAGVARAIAAIDSIEVDNLIAQATDSVRFNIVDIRARLARADCKATLTLMTRACLDVA